MFVRKYVCIRETDEGGGRGRAGGRRAEDEGIGCGRRGRGGKRDKRGGGEVGNVEGVEEEGGRKETWLCSWVVRGICGEDGGGVGGTREKG